MSMKTGANMRFESGSWQEAVYDIVIGCITGGAHYLYFVRKWVEGYLLNPLLKLAGMVEEPATLLPPNAGKLKVVGIGYGRTGTVRLLYCFVVLTTLLHCIQAEVVISFSKYRQVGV
jgi:hypothetical protein